MTPNRRTNNADHLSTMRWQINHCPIPKNTRWELRRVRDLLAGEPDAEVLTAMVLGGAR